MSLATRQIVPELMDDPAVAPAALSRVLRGLARFNMLSRSADILWPAIREVAMRCGKRPVRVLDVATGGGDVPIALARRARRHGIHLELHACDMMEHSLRHTEQAARAARVSVRLFQWNAEAQPAPESFDIVISSLFLHHLRDDAAVVVLRKLREMAREAVLINDLRRCRAGLIAAWTASRLLTRSPIIRFDAPQSVRAAFRVGELRVIAQRAGMENATVAPRFPWRLLLRWSRT